MSGGEVLLSLEAAEAQAAARRAHARRAALWFEPATLEGKDVPQRRWLVPDLIPRGAVTLLSGDGGVGKSLLAMQLMTAGALALPDGTGRDGTGRDNAGSGGAGSGATDAGSADWIGFPVARFSSLGFFCEDDGEELHRRQAAINAHYGCRFADLGRMRWMVRTGQDNLMLQYGWNGTAAPLVRQPFRELEEAVGAHNAELIVIDTAADVFGGNENVRAEVRDFVGRLRTLAAINDGAVLLMAHPSVAGLNSGSGLSGSTAWNNTVRSRLYLTRAAKEPGGGKDPDRRELAGMKANYAAGGRKLGLRWQAGVFVREPDEDTGMVAWIEQRAMAKQFAALVAIAHARKLPMSPWPSSTYAPLVIEQYLEDTHGMNRKRLAAAMQDAIRMQLVQIAKVTRGRGSRTRLLPLDADPLAD